MNSIYSKIGILKLIKISPLKINQISLTHVTCPRGRLINSIQDTVRFSCKKAPGEWLIHLEDLIKPEELKNLKEWDDYVLLIHYSDKASIIKKNGLRCCADINPELASLRRGLGFSNDPDLIYFRPKTPNSNFLVDKNSIVIAVPKKNVRVFNQEERVSGNFGFYIGRSMPVKEYDKLLSKIDPKTQCLRGDKQIVPYEKAGLDIYIPEVCFDDKYISPEYFVSM